MSDLLAQFKSGNDNFPEDFLEVEDGVGGLKLQINYKDGKRTKLLKFWLKEQDILDLIDVLEFYSSMVNRKEKK